MGDPVQNPSSQELLKQLENQPPQAGKKLNWKGFGIGIIIVIIIEIVAFNALKSDNKPHVSALRPTPVPTKTQSKSTQTTDTSSWITYTSRDDGYTFSYPNYWLESSLPADKENYSGVDVSCNKNNTCKRNDVVTDFSVSKNKTPLSLDSYLQQKQQYINSYTPPASITYTTVDGLKAIAIIYPGDSQAETGISYYVINNGIGYTIEYEIALPVEKKTFLKELPPLTPDILSTFKFTDQTNDTSNWKTYNNNNFHISFEYPGDWGVSNVNETTISISQLKGNSPPYIIGKAYNGTFAAFMPQTYIASMTSESISNPTYQVTQYTIKTKDTDQTGQIINITFVKNGNEQFVFEDYSGSKTLLAQILKTFKFTY